MKTVHSTIPVRLGWLRAEILSVLSDEWQTSPMIASQIVWPPETYERENWNRQAREEDVRLKSGTTAGFASRVIGNLFKRDICERRKTKLRIVGSTAKYEYRLKHPHKKGWMKAAVSAAIENGDDPYDIPGIPRATINHYKWRISKSNK